MKNKKRFKKLIAIGIVSAALLVSLLVTCFAAQSVYVTISGTNINIEAYYKSSSSSGYTHTTFTSPVNNQLVSSSSSYYNVYFKFSPGYYAYRVNGTFNPIGKGVSFHVGNIFACTSTENSAGDSETSTEFEFFCGTYAECIDKVRSWNLWSSNFTTVSSVTNHSDVILNLVTYAGSGTAVADGTTSITGLKAVTVGDSLTAGKYLLFDQIPAESDDYQIFDHYIVKADETSSVDFVTDELITELNYYAYDTYDAALSKGVELGLIEMPSVGEQLVDAMTAGFGMAPSFGSMIQNSFKSVFLTSEVDNLGNESITGLSDFGSVSLILVGIAVVTGLGMLIFRRFFKRS